MTTTTATTGTTASSVVSSATQSLLTSLGSGSGVDTASLVTQLVQAQFAAKTAQIASRGEALTSQISGAGSLKSTITGFSTALQSLIKGGSLSSQPVSGDSKTFTVSALPGARLANLSSSISVEQLASAQGSRTTTAISNRTDIVGSGKMTISLGKAVYGADGKPTGDLEVASSVDITLTNASLDSIATAINAAYAGVTANIVTNADGSAYLALKGKTGKAQAFTVSTEGDAALTQFDVGKSATGTTLSSVAQNAKLTVDGIAVERTGNSISDLVAGVKIDLARTSAAPVSLTASRTAGAAAQSIEDFVTTYNEVMNAVKTAVDPVNGPLKSDTAAQAMLRSLRGLTLRNLVPGAGVGTPTTLAQIGVGTNRDGTLKLDTTTLNKVLGSNPDAIDAMFASTTTGLAGALGEIATSATSTTIGLGASESRYNAAKSKLAIEQSDVDKKSEAMTTRLTKQFSTMNSRVNAYKSTQTFLENQIKAWNKSDS